VCTLRIWGKALDIDAFLAAIPLRAAATHRRGESRFPRTKPGGTLNQVSTINVGVSDADFSDLSAQLEDARAFLREHMEHLRAARSYPGVEGLVLDFPVQKRDALVQSDTFPAALLAEMGSLGIDLEISLYPQFSSE
jgi:hypothetical protein